MRTLSELQDMRKRICDEYVWGTMSHTEFTWQYQLANGLIDQHLDQLRTIFAR